MLQLRFNSSRLDLDLHKSVQYWFNLLTNVAGRWRSRTNRDASCGIWGSRQRQRFEFEPNEDQWYTIRTPCQLQHLDVTLLLALISFMAMFHITKNN